jgi:hypothetical protein
MLGINSRKQLRMQRVKDVFEQAAKPYPIVLGKAGDDQACAVQRTIRINKTLLKLDCLLSFHHFSRDAAAKS